MTNPDTPTARTIRGQARRFRRAVLSWFGAGWRAAEEDKYTLARGRWWLLWWHGPLGHALDWALVRYAGWSPVYWLFAHRTDRGLPGVPILLHTTGRLSGRVRTVVLPAFARDGRWIVCGTMAGGKRDPQWVKNLASDPRASLHLRRRPVPVRGRILAGQDRDAVLAWLVPAHRSLEIYQAKADLFGRLIPIVELTPDNQ
jgi:deazaflavin-dependent oxidoreductase (nitroreductase family)